MAELKLGDTFASREDLIRAVRVQSTPIMRRVCRVSMEVSSQIRSLLQNDSKAVITAEPKFSYVDQCSASFAQTEVIPWVDRKQFMLDYTLELTKRAANYDDRD